MLLTCFLVFIFFLFCFYLTFVLPDAISVLSFLFLMILIVLLSLIYVTDFNYGRWLFISLSLSSTQVSTTAYHSPELEWLQCQGELDAAHW